MVRLAANFYVKDTKQKGIEFHGSKGSLHPLRAELGAVPADSPVEAAAVYQSQGLRNMLPNRIILSPPVQGNGGVLAPRHGTTIHGIVPRPEPFCLKVF